LIEIARNALKRACLALFHMCLIHIPAPIVFCASERA
jgi:hypothetical protein